MEELTIDNFKEKTSKGNVMVDFWAAWCGPCKVLGPEFEAASKEAKDVHFFKVDVDNQSELASQLGIRSIPTVIFLKDGEKVADHVGSMYKDEILEKIKENFS